VLDFSAEDGTGPEYQEITIERRELLMEREVCNNEVVP
jgi:hypothetical protein